jgi:lipopolysaccharide export system protein LptA
MPRSRPTFRSHVGRFRGVLLVALVAFVAVLGALFYFGRQGKRPPARPRGDAAGVEEGMKLVGREFDYTFTNREKPVFHIKGSSVRVDKDETVFLEKVALTLWDKSGQAWNCESDEASLNQTTKEGRLWGDVSVTGPSKLEVHTPQLEIREKGNLIVTPRPARILYADKYFIRAESLQVWIPDEVYSLIGDLRIASLPGVAPAMTLTAERGVYERKQRQVHVEGNASLHRGKSEISAAKLSGTLSPDESSMTFLRALWQVSGQTAADEKEGSTVTHFSGRDLAVLLEPQGNKVRQVDLSGTPAERAVLKSVGGGFTRTLTAPHIEGLLAASVLSSAHAEEGVDLHEEGPPPAPRARPRGPAAPATRGIAAAHSMAPAVAGRAAPKPVAALATAERAAPKAVAALAAAGPRVATGAPAAAAGAKPAGAAAAAGAGPGAASRKPPAPPRPIDRRAYGRRADATFRSDGQLATVNLIEKVTYDDGEIKAAGARAAIDLEAGRGEFFGSPVDASSPRGEVHTPHLTYTSADEVMHAEEGVRAVLEQGEDHALASTPLGAGKGPISVEAREGYWRRNPTSFLFRGDVRAWRDDNLLLAPELIGERLEQGDQLRAIGGVKTVWVPNEQEGGGAKAARPAGAGGGAGSGGAGSGAARGGAGGAGAAPAGAGAAAAGQGDAAKRGPITVLAQNLLYRDGAGVLTYTGNVRVDQEGKTLTCQQLDAELDKDKKAKTLICTGQAHLNDPATGRFIDGDKAVYQLATRKIDMVGEPVTMRDKDGNIVHGKRLLYSIDNGKVEVLGKDAAAGGPAGAAPPAPGAQPGSAPAKPPGQQPGAPAGTAPVKPPGAQTPQPGPPVKPPAASPPGSQPAAPPRPGRETK